MEKNTNLLPDLHLNASSIFGIDCPFDIPAFSQKTAYVPEIDESYVFDKNTLLAILAGFRYNKPVLISGYHGTGKSSHIEQVAARLNWPCLRINLDSHISRIDLMGKDAIQLEDGKQITKFQQGLLPFAFQNNIALVLDEYDAGRPDVLFVLQRLLESNGRLTILEENKVLTPHPAFRLFATANTVGLGDTLGIYHGTQQMNQAQMDRWAMVINLNYLAPEIEENILLKKLPHWQNTKGKARIKSMVQLANMTRIAFKNTDVSTVMSPRTLLIFAENYEIFKNTAYAFYLSFLNKCDELEKPIFAEFYQRAFGEELSEFSLLFQLEENPPSEDA